MIETEEKDEFLRQAQGKDAGLVRELIDFMAHNKKWWLLPLLAALLLIGLLIVLGGSGAAPFIYTLF